MAATLCMKGLLHGSGPCPHVLAALDAEKWCKAQIPASADSMSHSVTNHRLQFDVVANDVVAND